MLELFNTTDQIKRIPKYRYDGKYMIPPYSAVGPIQEDQAYFFKPYSKMGIVVRTILQSEDSIHDEPVSVHTSVHTSVSSYNTVENIVDKAVEDKKEDKKEDIEIPKLETFVDNLEKVDEVPVNPEKQVVDAEKSGSKKVYTEEDLISLSREDLRDIAVSFGLDASRIRGKEDIRKMILSAQG